MSFYYLCNIAYCDGEHLSVLCILCDFEIKSLDSMNQWVIYVSEKLNVYSTVM